MLKSHETGPEQAATEKAPAVGGNRVTPEELSQALAAIEARKQQEASRLAGTIPIEDAVSELHLDSTPDEIWAEVRAQREKQAAARHVAEPSAQTAPQTHPQVPLVTPLRVRNRKWRGLIAPIVVFWVLFQTGIIPHFRHNPVRTSAPVLRSLAQIPNGQEIYGDTAALLQLSEGKPLAQIMVNGNQSDNCWSLIRIGGHVYLRAYTAAKTPLTFTPGQALNVFNDNNSGDLSGIETAVVKVRVDKIPMQKSGGDDGYTEVTIPNLQPDSQTTIDPGR